MGGAFGRGGGAGRAEDAERGGEPDLGEESGRVWYREEGCGSGGFEFVEWERT